MPHIEPFLSLHLKKGRCHGARHGKTEEQKEYFVAFNAWKRCGKRVDAGEEHYKGIHDRFLRVQVYSESQLKIGWTEQKCSRWTNWHRKITRTVSPKEEFKRYQGQWCLTLNKSGKNAPMRLRSDFRAAVSIKEPSPSRIRRRSRTTHFSSTTSEMALFLKRFLVELGHVQKPVELMKGQFNSFFICCSWVSYTADSNSRYTSHVTFSLSQRTCFMMCDTPHWLKCLHERVMSYSRSSMSCV